MIKMIWLLKNSIRTKDPKNAQIVKFGLNWLRDAIIQIVNVEINSVLIALLIILKIIKISMLRVVSVNYGMKN